MPSKFPNALIKGATIGLLCPAGGFVDYKPIKLVIEYLELKGFNVKLGKSLIAGKNTFNYLSGPDSDRAKDLNDFFSDDKIDAIFCLRGGYGCLRLLELLDYKKIQKSKKLILGYSDITALLLAIYKKSNLLSFHGPMLGLKKKKLLKPTWEILSNESFDFLYSHIPVAEKIKNGKAKGVLLGGNLTVLCSMIGSEYLPDFKKAILFLEDCNEEPYKLDRMFTQLDNAGILSQISGLVLGTFVNCRFKSNKELKSFFIDKIKKYKMPTVYNFPVGHGKQNFIMPIGMNVILDADNLSLRSC